MDSPQINHVDHNKILLINPTGKMRQLQVHPDTKILKKNTWVLVEKVQPHDLYKMLYGVTTHWWRYHLFKISAVFY